MRILIIILLCSIGSLSFGQPNYKDWDAFLKKYVSPAGSVDYKNIKSNIKELHAIVHTFSMQKISSNWNINDKLAFWINAYNLFTIKLIVDNYPIKSIQHLDGGKPWDVKRIIIGGKKYSLNDLENDMIRAPFKDARIHFAINCAAKSCPPLLNAAFFPNTLEVQLENQTKKFFLNKQAQQIGTNVAKLSKILDWYKSDFGNITSFINTYSDVKISTSTKIEYLTYDWSLNDKVK
jgi:hypothetical protein